MFHNAPALDISRLTQPPLPSITVLWCASLIWLNTRIRRTFGRWQKYGAQWCESDGIPATLRPITGVRSSLRMNIGRIMLWFYCEQLNLWDDCVLWQFNDYIGIYLMKVPWLHSHHFHSFYSHMIISRFADGQCNCALLFLWTTLYVNE